MSSSGRRWAEDRMTFGRLASLGVVSEADPEPIRALYAGRDGLPPDLPVIDYLTIRDLTRDGTASDVRVHALLMAMLLARVDGSVGVVVQEGPLRELFATCLPDGLAGGLAADVAAWWAADGFDCALVVSDVGDGMPLVGERYRPVVRSGPQACFHRYFVNHASLRRRLRDRVAEAAQPPLGDEALAAHAAQVLSGNPLRQAGRTVELNADQKLAVGLAALRRLVVISGGPGTGKTSTVFTIARVLLRAGVRPERIRLAAPTGRAARRMTESIAAGLAGLLDPADPADAALRLLVGTTLHRLLDYDVGRDMFRFDAGNPLAADVVIVDEVSMVDVVLMARLLDAVPPAARLVLLGDKDQLPSVEAGTVLADLLPPGTQMRLAPATRSRLQRALRLADEAFADAPDGDGRGTAGGVPEDTVVLLRTNYRSQRHIQDVAAAVNAGRVEAIDSIPTLDLRAAASSGGGAAARSVWPLEAKLEPPGGPAGGGCWLLRDGGPDGWRRVLAAWARHHFLDAAGDEPAYASLVARCAMFESEELLGSGPVEALLGRIERFRVLTVVREGWYGCEQVNALLGDGLRPELDLGARGHLFAGAPVMVVRNDHVRQVYNGDVGVCVRDRSGGLHAVFRTAGGLVSYAPDALPAHELAFAVTVHKAQGSEYGQVLLVLPEDPCHRLLSREVVYTGMTRAKTLCVVHASPDALRAGIARRIHRRGGGIW